MPTTTWPETARHRTSTGVILYYFGLTTTTTTPTTRLPYYEAVTLRRLFDFTDRLAMCVGNLDSESED